MPATSERRSLWLVYCISVYDQYDPVPVRTVSRSELGMLSTLSAADARPARHARVVGRQRAGEHHLVGRRRPAARGQALDQLLEQLTAAGRRLPRGVQLRLRVGEPGPGLRERRLPLAVDQAVGDLVGQQPRGQGEHHRAQREGAEDHPGLQRDPPQLHQGPERPAEHPAHQDQRVGEGDPHRVRLLRLGRRLRGRGVGLARGAVSRCRPCTRHRAPSPRSRVSRGRARSWSAAVARAR